MLSLESLESVIRRHVVLGPRSAQGFEQVKCALCKDYKVRAGFKFEQGTIGYNCFNCGAKTIFKDTDTVLSKKMRQILTAFGVPADEVTRSVAGRFFNPKAQTEAAPKKKVHYPQEVKLPARSVLITSEENPWCEVAREYLAVRGFNAHFYPFYVSPETNYEGRIIIPFFMRGKIVYWQARAMDRDEEPRYRSPMVPRDMIVFNHDALEQDFAPIHQLGPSPLFVTEGTMDALSLWPNAIALAGSSLNEHVEGMIKRCSDRGRRVIFVLDRDKDGAKLGKKVIQLDYGWEVASLPVKDANEAINVYGKLWTLQHLASTAVKGVAGQLLVRFLNPRMTW